MANNNSGDIKNDPILPKNYSTPNSLNMGSVTTTTPSLAQIGKQTSFNLRNSQLYESDTDEQSRLIRSPSARKFIIIPATSTPTNTSRNSRPPSTASLASLAAVLQKVPPQQQQPQQPRRQISVNSSSSLSPAAAAVTKPNFDIYDATKFMQPSSNTPAADVAHQMKIATMTTPTTTTTFGGVTFSIEEPESVDGKESTNGLINLPTYLHTPSPGMLTTTATIIGRPSYERSNSSMRSIASANMPNIFDTAHDQSFHQHYLQSAASYDGRDLSASSYMYHDHVANQIYSDVTSVRSLASIGIGSTDGKKLVVRRIPNTPNELFDLVNPPSPPLPGIDYDDDDSFMDNDEAAKLKPRQQHWSNKMQFVLACIGYSVGLGNVWRFPYMCYKSGGGVFLVPYCIILFICSIPLLYMELSVGQYTGRGPIGCIGQLCPIFKGAGLASVVVSFLMSTYYSVIIAYSIYYFFTSFRSQMPWVDCSNRWNTPDCWVPQRKDLNITSPPMSRTPSEEFFENKVLQISPGIEYPGLMRWELFACLICAWLMVYFATWKSIKSSAKVRYFTATFPFFLIIVLLARAVTLDGADEGLRYFFRPNWSELKNANVWINAASQNFNSLGITFGSMISFASYNKYNNNILQDTVAVSMVNMITSLLVGIFSFATLGNLALEQNTNVKDVINDGPGLIFVVYPQAMAKMPYAQLWAVMFFFMLLCLGLNSQFAIVEVVVTSIQDGFPNWIKRNLGYHEIVVLFVCVIAFVFGLPNLIQGGIYYFQLMDHYAASVTIMFLAFCQVIAIAWFYGTDRLSKNIKQMTGKEPSLYFKSCWNLFGPCLLFAIWVLSLINYKEPSYHNGRYKYPDWAYGVGWLIASMSLVCIPAYAVINILRSQGSTLFQRIRNTMRPNIYECKICGEHHCEHDFPEQEQYMLANELSGNYKLVQQLKPLNVQEKPSQLSKNDKKVQEGAEHLKTAAANGN